MEKEQLSIQEALRILKADKPSSSMNEDLEEENDIAQKFSELLDMETINKVIELAGPEDRFIVPEYKKHGYFFTKTRYYYGIRPEEAARLINKFYKEQLAELNNALTYKNCDWYPIIKDWLKQQNDADYCKFIFQGKDGKVYVPDAFRLDRRYGDIDKLTRTLEKAGIPADADLVGLVVHDSYVTHYTMHDSKYYTYVSLSNKANQEAMKVAGVDLAPSQPSDDHVEWGKNGEWEEVSKDAANRYPKLYLINGMDKWYSKTYTSFATD